jgi:uncharacterized protein (TIGR02145 family)
MDWSGSNLRAYRSFAENATDYGAYFRWDDNVAYNYNDGAIVPNFNSPSTTWTSGTDPCPDGWRVPTWPEYDALLTASTTKTWGTSGGINGVTYTSTNGTLFFPAAGRRNGSTSNYHTTDGYYWSSTQNATTAAYRLVFYSTYPGYTSANTKYTAMSVRCVRPITANPVGEVLVEGTTVNSRAVYWAKTNVGTTAKTFESTVTAYGGYYLWDDDTPYTYTGGTTPPSTSSSATTWQSANNPCPTDWELPTRQDILDLLAASTATWGPSGTINGMTYTSPNGTLFFPAAGWREGSHFGEQTTVGYYWSSAQSGTINAYGLYFLSTTPGTTEYYPKFYALPIRCVRPK